MSEGQWQHTREYLTFKALVAEGRDDDAERMARRLLEDRSGTRAIVEWVEMSSWVNRRLPPPTDIGGRRAAVGWDAVARDVRRDAITLAVRAYPGITFGRLITVALRTLGLPPGDDDHNRTPAAKMIAALAHQDAIVRGHDDTYWPAGHVVVNPDQGTLA